MAELETSVEGHYGRGALFATLLAALEQAGVDPRRIALADLAPIEGFHVRGLEATRELVQRVRPVAGARVLDVGCGIGGTARLLAAEHGCRVTGVDLTEEYVETGRRLVELLGLGELVELRRASALELPFADGSFDLVWTEHVQMNVLDKRAFYRELARVLAPGGRLAFHDLFQGPGGPALLPAPWAEMDATSFLVPPDEARAAVAAAGLEMLEEEDTTERTSAWFDRLASRMEGAAPPLGIHLFLGESARVKVRNLAANLRERRVVARQAVLSKP